MLKKTDFINLITSATDMGALEKLYKQAKKALSASTTKVQEEDGDSKEYILAGLAEACREMKLARQGKLKGRPARELLNEL